MAGRYRANSCRARGSRHVPSGDVCAAYALLMRSTGTRGEDAMIPFADDGDHGAPPPDLTEFDARHEATRRLLLERSVLEVGDRFQCP